MTEQKLLQCPFCGKQPLAWWVADTLWDEQYTDDGYAIECCYVYVHKSKKADAIQAWNTRSGE